MNVHDEKVLFGLGLGLVHYKMYKSGIGLNTARSNHTRTDREQLEALCEAWTTPVWLGQWGDLQWMVRDKGGLYKSGLAQHFENYVHDFSRRCPGVHEVCSGMKDKTHINVSTMDVCHGNNNQGYGKAT